MSPLLLGLFVGGGWGLASLACLGRLLDAWLRPRPSTRRVVGWLLVKFPLLYLVALLVLRGSPTYLFGFGLGFTLSLAAVIARLAWRGRPEPMRAHGR